MYSYIRNPVKCVRLPITNKQAYIKYCYPYHHNIEEASSAKYLKATIDWYLLHGKTTSMRFGPTLI